MAVTANIHEAKTTLSKLIERALAGEEVIIAKAGKPLVKLTPVSQAGEADRDRVRQDRLDLFGSMRGKLILSDDWERSEFDEDLERRLYGEVEGERAHAAEPGRPFDRQ